MGVWQSALLAVLGGALTTLGTWSGARWQAREARAVREQQLAHEDRYRLHERRIECYAAFYLAVGATRQAISRYAKEREDNDRIRAMRTSRNELWERYVMLALIADDEVTRAGRAILNMATAVAFEGADPDVDHYVQAVGVFANIARRAVLRPGDNSQVDLISNLQSWVSYGGDDQVSGCSWR